MPGHLLIAGGNIKNNIIYKEFIKLAGGKNANIAIVPTASSDTEITLSNLTDTFDQLGIDRRKIIGIRIDPDNEGNGWKKSGDDFTTLDFLNEVKGVWFAGGDQVKIIRGILKGDGSDTKVLQKIRKVLASGGVIGGSSAGAAIMSDVMIGGGTSFGALSLPHYYNYNKYRKNPKLEEDGVLLIMKGLGFLKLGIIDQHFDKRNRVGRLIETMFSERVNMGFGISENTALIYNFENDTMNTIGDGGAVVLDISDAKRIKIGNYSKITNIKINCLNNNITYNAKENKFYIKINDNIIFNNSSIFESYISKVISNINLTSTGDNKSDYLDIYLSGVDAGYAIRIYKGEGSYNAGKCTSNIYSTVMDIIPIISKTAEFNAAE